MEIPRPTIEYETRPAAAVRVGDKLITPQARALRVQGPYFGLVWNRPSAVVEEDGRKESIPIPDITRRTIIALAFLAVITSVLSILLQLSDRRMSE